MSPSRAHVRRSTEALQDLVAQRHAAHADQQDAIPVGRDSMFVTTSFTAWRSSRLYIPKWPTTDRPGRAYRARTERHRRDLRRARPGSGSAATRSRAVGFGANGSSIGSTPESRSRPCDRAEHHFVISAVNGGGGCSASSRHRRRGTAREPSGPQRLPCAPSASPTGRTPDSSSGSRSHAEPTARAGAGPG